MCSKFESIRLDDDLRRYYAAVLRQSGAIPAVAPITFPKLSAAFIRRPPERVSGDDAVPEREAVIGRFGLVPFATKPEKAKEQMKLSTFNARTETVAKSFTFGGAWRRAQHCIVPAYAFYEPDWRTGAHISTRITRADGKPLGIAGLWDRWPQPNGDDLLSFTMLTINAAAHPVMCNYHRPDDEKRMIVLLREEDYDAWLDAPADRSMEFMRQCPPDDLKTEGLLETPSTRALMDEISTANDLTREQK